MSLANAVLLAASCAGGGFVIAFVFTVWLADRELRGMRARIAAQRTENDALIDDNRELRADLKRADADAAHTAMERDAVLDDNLRMHKTLQRHMHSMKGAA